MQAKSLLGLAKLQIYLFQSLVNDDDNKGDDLEKTLVEIELSALKRVIKLKPNEAALFHNNQHQNNWLDGEYKLCHWNEWNTSQFCTK